MRLDDDNASLRFNQAGLRKFMGDLEVEIMELVWQEARPTVTVRHIYELMRKRRSLAYTTVMTTMVRLAEKGMLRIVDKAGLANRYAPAQTRDHFIQYAVSKILAIFFKHFPGQCDVFMKEYFSSTGTKKTGQQARKR